LLGNLAWPFINQPAMLLVTALPLAITAVKYFKSDFKDPRAAEFILTFGFWGFLQAAALAYARMHLGSSSRYMDTLSVFPLASLASLLILGESADYRRLSRPLMNLLAVVWIGWLFWGMWQISWTTMGGRQVEYYMQFSRRTGLIQERNVRAFVATGDPSHLMNKQLWDIPYPEAGGLMTLLRDPTLQKIMPPACRPPFKLEVTSQSRDPRVAAGNLEEWGRFSAYARLLLDHAVAILLAGLGLGVLLAGSTAIRRGIPGSGPASTRSGMDWLMFLAGLAALVWIWWERNFLAG
jgi:hypothetical protein